MARAALKLSVRDVASAASVSPTRLRNFEAGEPVNHSTTAAIRAALEIGRRDLRRGERRRAGREAEEGAGAWLKYSISDGAKSNSRRA